MPADTDLNHLFRIWSDATATLDKYGLKAKGWKVVFDNTKRRGGQCRYGAREIGISAHLFAIWTYEAAMNTVLHEIAHALCPYHGHDKVWKAKAIEIGCTGARGWDVNNGVLEARKRKWTGTCPAGHTRIRVRPPMKDRRYSCGDCVPGKFAASAVLTWEKKT
jgi:predicted SprT family Zn-dependent metalloprotease